MKMLLFYFMISLCNGLLKYRTTKESVLNMSRHLVQDSLFENMISSIKIEKKREKKKECTYSIKEILFEKYDLFDRYGQDARMKQPYVKSVCSSIDKTCCTSKQMEYLVDQIKNNFKYEQRMQEMDNLIKYIKDKFKEDFIEEFLETDLIKKERCLYKDQTMDMIKTSFFSLIEKNSQLLSKYNEYLLYIYKEQIKLNCIICDLQYQEDMFYKAKQQEQFTIKIDESKEIRKYFKIMKQFFYFQDIKVLTNFFICLKYQLNYNSTEIENIKIYEKVFSAFQDNQEDIVFQEKPIKEFFRQNYIPGSFPDFFSERIQNLFESVFNDTKFEEQPYQLVSHWIPFEFQERSAVKSYSKGNFNIVFSKFGIKLSGYKISLEEIYQNKIKNYQTDQQAVFDSDIPGDMKRLHEQMIKQEKKQQKEQQKEDRINNYEQQQQEQVQTDKDKKKEYCGDNVYPKVPYSNQEMQENRQLIRNPFSKQWPKIFYFFTKNDSGSLFSAFPSISVFMFLYLSIFLITNFIFCFVFCRRKNVGFNQKLYVKIAMVIFGLIIIVFLIMFIMMIINDQFYRKIYCNFYATLSPIDEGSFNNQKYIGIDNIQSLFEALALDEEKMKEKQSIFKKIAQEKCSSLTNKSLQDYRLFIDNYEEKKLLNQEEKLKVSISNMSLDREQDLIIYSKLQEQNKVGFGIQDFGDIGSNPITYFSLKPGAEGYSKLMQLIQFTYKFFLYTFDQGFQNQINLSRFTCILFTMLALVTILIMGYILFVVYKIAFQNKKKHRIFAMKLILIFLSLIALTYSILSFVIIISNAITSSFCGFLAEINQGNTQVFDTLIVKPDDIIRSIFEVGFDKYSDGDISKVLFTNLTAQQQTEYPKIINLLNGMTQYEYFIKNDRIKNVEDDIVFKSDFLKQVNEGVYEDHFNFKQKLEELNQLISCSSEQFSMNSQCQNCINLQNEQSYTPKECVQNKEQVVQLINGLQNSLKITTNNIDSMQEDLINKKDSLLNRERQTLDKLQNIKSNFENIQPAFTQTKQILDKFNLPLDQYYDMRIIQETSLRFEMELCFKQQYFVNIISILGVILSILFYLFCWMYYCATIHENQDMEKIVYGSIDENNDDQIYETDKKSEDLIVEKEYDIEDMELEPNY